MQPMVLTRMGGEASTDLFSLVTSNRTQRNKQHGAVTGEVQAGYYEKVLHWEGGRALKQGSGHSCCSPRSVWTMVLQIWLNFLWSCVEPGVDDTCRYLSAQGIL